MGKMTKYSDLQPDDVFKWGASTYIWLADTYGSIMCIYGPDRKKGSRNVYVGALSRYQNVLEDGSQPETEWEVIGKMVFLDINTEHYEEWTDFSKEELKTHNN